MAVHAMNWPLVRCVAYLRRIAEALERAYPRPRRGPRVPADFSVATTEAFDRAYLADNPPLYGPDAGEGV